ncbi:Carbon monoxide dehydrogenase subunit G [Streptosporangium subroseum]|uniref:Carbon monoxide dehydrogenase subunit G n=1 Tax=Streptosporangium subroseum TaxID=106412 RepID=A0A239JES4_9ACTN|nr:SRPBCC family protein [Streptosporangium subroseum]SNT04102.1 Carbon monoxide dehydrogenase subunit G [Streptosporangium subroseum]
MAMRFEHEFTVPVPVEQAWSVLLDVERVAPCLPGAALDTVGDDSFTGRMKVKVGPITVIYQGEATFEDVDKDAHSLTIKAAGKEARGSGTAGATVIARLHPEGTDTRVTVDTSFNVTGRPAQFGRGVMAEIGGKLIDKFAANLAALLGTGSETSETEPEVPGQVGTGKAGESPEKGPRIMEGPEVTESLDVTESEILKKEEPVRHLAAVPSSYGFVTTERAVSREAHPAGTSRTSLSPDEEALNLLEVAGLPLLKRVAPVVAALAGLVLIGWLVRRTLRRR